MRAVARVILLAAFCGSAYGCSCIGIDVETVKSNAEVVFRGTIFELRDTGATPAPTGPQMARSIGKRAIFHVSRVWKGDVGPTFEMPAVEETSACIGFWPDHLKVGNELLVYASRIGGSGDYFSNICTRTALASKAKDFEELGPGSDPKTAEQRARDLKNLPDGPTLYRKYLDATRDYAAARTVAYSGRIRVKFGGSLEGRLTGYLDINKHSRLTIEFSGLGTMDSGFDGTTAWSRSDSTGPKLLSREEGQTNGFGLMGSGRFDVETVGEDEQDRKPCYVVRLTPRGGGKTATACLDQATGLMVRTETTGNPMSRQVLRDYKEEAGIKIAHTIEVNLSGLPATIEMTNITINEDLPKHIFDPPEDVKALIDAKKRSAQTLK